MSFKNLIFGVSGVLAIAAISSPNYDPGVDGWQISKDGSAEFNDITLRGKLTLPDDYTARQRDMISTPTTVPSPGNFNEFDPAAWLQPVFLTYSNRAEIQIFFEGYNKVSTTSTLRLAPRIYSAPASTGPWTQEVDFAVANSAMVSSQSGPTGSNAAYQGHMTLIQRPLSSDLTNRPWIKVSVGWRLSSGTWTSADIISARLTVAPLI